MQVLTGWLDTTQYYLRGICPFTSKKIFYKLIQYSMDGTILKRQVYEIQSLEIKEQVWAKNATLKSDDNKHKSDFLLILISSHSWVFCNTCQCDQTRTRMRGRDHDQNPSLAQKQAVLHPPSVLQGKNSKRHSSSGTRNILERGALL